MIIRNSRNKTFCRVININGLKDQQENKILKNVETLKDKLVLQVKAIEHKQ